MNRKMTMIGCVRSERNIRAERSANVLYRQIALKSSTGPFAMGRRRRPWIRGWPGSSSAGSV